MAEETTPITDVYILNTGGTLGMTGKPLRPAKSAEELLEGINVSPRVNVKTLEDFPVRQDSTNVRHAQRLQMAQCVANAYDTHNAFVILHGTDSLAETTSALAMFFKRSLQKPLIVTGSQMTKEERGSDMRMQMENTLRICRAMHRKEFVGVLNVCIGDVLDGTRLRKRNESDFAAFYTPGRPPLAKTRPTIMLQEHLLSKLDPVRAAEGLRIDEKIEPRLGTIKVTADTPPAMLTRLLPERDLNGVILECKGAGNIPDVQFDESAPDERSLDRMSWIDAIREATRVGVHVGIISPFDDGRVDLERYELGAKAKEAGAISLESLTPDMADIKFRMAIAMHSNDPARIQQFLSTNLVGELLPGIEEEEDED